jgi:hypothetical protein
MRGFCRTSNTTYPCEASSRPNANILFCVTVVHRILVLGAQEARGHAAGGGRGRAGPAADAATDEGDHLPQHIHVLHSGCSARDKPGRRGDTRDGGPGPAVRLRGVRQSSCAASKWPACPRCEVLWLYTDYHLVAFNGSSPAHGLGCKLARYF